MDDGRTRCAWAGSDPLYQAYHDEEWGVPEWDDRALYEKLVLDSFQAGLAWITILRKRENFRRAFAGFDPAIIAGWGESEITRLMSDVGIVRNRAKIEAAIAGARGWLGIVEREGAFAPFLWRFVGGRPKINHWRDWREAPAESAESGRMSKALRQAGSAEAEEQFATAQDELEAGDTVIIASVIVATALVLFGVAGVARVLRLKVALTGIAYVVLVGALAITVANV